MYLLDRHKVIESNLIKLSCNSPTTPAVFSPVNSDFNFNSSLTGNTYADFDIGTTIDFGG